MLVGKCLNTYSTTPSSRSQICSQRCCAFVSSSGHQQAQVAQAAARTSATSEVCQGGIVATAAGHLSGLYQLLDQPRAELSVQAQLNDHLKHCSTWEELSTLLEANLDIVDFVNISTIWTRLAKLFETRGGQRRGGFAAHGGPPVRDPAFRRFLARLIDTTSQQLRLFGVQALANVMWALSNADWHLEQYEPAVDRLMHVWCLAVHDRLSDLRAPDVSNISTAIGRLDHRWRPEFVVEFYRSVLHRPDLVEHLDLTTLNNLLYGMSRAGRRGLIHMGPATRRLLAQCVDRILERSDREAAGLVPWRAAQLLYNCHKFKLRMRSNLYAVLMPLVAEVYACEPSPLDNWSFGFLTAFVAAHRRVHPALRPDLRPLYAYVERRMSEASTSQMAMLAHAFRDLGCPPPAPFWGQLFSRYIPITAEPLATASLGQQQQQQVLSQSPQPPPLPPMPQQHVVSSQRQWQSHTSTQDLAAEVTDRWSSQIQPQPPQLQPHSPPGQHGERLDMQGQTQLSTAPSMQQRQHTIPSRQPQMHSHYQQQQRRVDCTACSESITVPDVHRSPHKDKDRSAHFHLPPTSRTSRPAWAQMPSTSHQQNLQQQQKLRRVHSEPHSLAGADWQLQERPQSSQVTQEPPQQLDSTPREPLPSQFAQEQLRSRVHQQQPQLSAQPHAHSYPSPRPHVHHLLHPRPNQPQQASRIPQLEVSEPGNSAPTLATSAPMPGTAVTLSDDLTEPRTLHYVCWQAAKAGILPPRAFLLLYVDRVPQWLMHSADDTQVAQAVETLKLLRWVPRRELREMLCATLKRRAATSRLPMRSLLRWVRKQR